MPITPKTGSLFHADSYHTAITQSISRKANCRDNAPMKSFLGTPKTELAPQCEYRDRDAARRDPFAYSEGYYNPRRIHSAIGCLTPEQPQRKTP
jgi:putative transposase